MKLIDLLHDHATSMPDTCAFVASASGEKMTYGEAREFLDNLSPSEGQMKKLGYLIRENNVSDLIPSFIRESLKRGQVSKMIDLLVQKNRHGNIDTPALEKLVAQVDPPATPEQLETVRAYQENGS